ncbi:MAG: efflux RND transporter periplasmic adaptor subunit [Prosthecobacter sp.]
MNKLAQTILKPGFVLMLIVGVLMFLIGWRIAKGPAESHDHPKAESETATLWTCAMHPQIRQLGPGKCPICKMNLIPATSKATGGLREITVMPETAAMLDFRVTPVIRAAALRELRLFGTVTYDERRVQNITAWVGGRLDRMFVDFTGTRVRKGDHLAEIYSPDLFVAQQDLIQARRQLEATNSSTQRLLYDAVREKLRLLGIPAERIDAMAAADAPSDHVVLSAPQDGIVVEKIAREGDYVSVGQKLYTIADLDMVWVNLEAYESDLPWLRFAQDATFTSEAIPGREFHGRVAFIDPVLDRKRRVVSVRVNVQNEAGLLKPGMFVSGRIHSEIDASGRAVTNDLQGKWVSPMHPEIIKDGPGVCDICGMKLERAEDLGFISPGKAEKLPLLVPASAVLRTGERAVVYLKLPKDDALTFEGREVLLGARAGDQYIVESGLAEGDLVLTRGAFKLDSELQLQARPSMMNPIGGLPQMSALKPDTALAGQWPPVLRAIQHIRNDAEPKGGSIIQQIEAFDLSVVDLDAGAVWKETQPQFDQ